MAQDGHDLAMPGWPIEVMGLANKSERLGGQAGLALSIKVRDLGARLAPGPVDKSEGLGGRAGPKPYR